MMRHEHDHKVL